MCIQPILVEQPEEVLTQDHASLTLRTKPLVRMGQIQSDARYLQAAVVAMLQPVLEEFLLESAGADAELAVAQVHAQASLHLERVRIVWASRDVKMSLDFVSQLDREIHPSGRRGL